MKKGHDAEKKVTENNLKHGKQFSGFWMCIIYNLPQQSMTFWTISSNSSNTTKSSRLKGKEQKVRKKDKKYIKPKPPPQNLCVSRGWENK